MNSKVNLRTTRWLLAAVLSFGAVAAHALSGVVVTEGQETKVAVGMSAADVQQTLGRPAHIHKYANEVGPTWTYEVLGGTFGKTDFDIDFGSNGKVTSVGERVIGSH